MKKAIGINKRKEYKAKLYNRVRELNVARKDGYVTLQLSRKQILDVLKEEGWTSRNNKTLTLYMVNRYVQTIERKEDGEGE